MADTFRFTFKNKYNPLIVIIEPWCEELPLPVGSRIEFLLDFDMRYPFETDLTDKYFTVYLMHDGPMKVLIDKVDVTPPSLREPA